MIREIGILLMGFRECFNKLAAFEWFVIVITGFIFRLDHHGITSIIRWLALRTNLYTALLSFFRAWSWNTEEIMERWRQVVFSQTSLVQISGRYVLIGDGIKVPKEAQKMPGVKKLRQESDNSGKPEYISGHHHGVLGLLAGEVKKTLLYSPLCGTA